MYLREQADAVVASVISARARNPAKRDQRLDDFVADFWADRHGRPADFVDFFAELYGRENLRVRSYKQARGDIGRDAVTAMGLTPEGFDFEIPRVNATPAERECDPRVIAGLREISREQNERVVREWFPGQKVEDVFEFPDL